MAADAPLIVVNPNASRLADPRRRATLVDRVVASTRSRSDRPPDVVEGDHASALEALATVADRPLVVAVGGDGTVRDAAVAVASAGIPLAVVPAGPGTCWPARSGSGPSQRRCASSRRACRGASTWASRH
jgi:diacylglycerol kinase family enzyme